MYYRLSTWLLIGALVTSDLAAAEERWTSVASAHFEVLTDASAGRGRETLGRFEQILFVLKQFTGFQPALGHPVRVFVFRSAAEFTAYKQPQFENAVGYYRRGPDQDLIAMDAGVADAHRVVFHEYVHLFLARSGVRVPLWLEEGLAELFSTVDVSGAQIRVGAPIPTHVRKLREQTWLDLPVLFGVNHDSVLYHERDRAGIFYAESWALTHMLALGNSAGPDVLVGLLRGTPDGPVTSKPPAGLAAELHAYVETNRFRSKGFRAGPRSGADRIEEQALAPADSELALAGLLLALGRTSDARQRVEKLPGSVPALAMLGDIALREGHREEALSRYAQAIALGTTNARIYFERAMLLRDMPVQPDQVRSDLRRAVLLDPNYAEARHLTAILALRDGRYEEAAAHLKVVTELTPQNLSAWQSLAMAQSQLGHRPEAIAAAAHARSLASNQEEIDMTEATIRLVNSPAQQQGATAPLHRDGAVPSTWQNRTGDHSVTGTLVQLDCLGSVARLHVSSRDGVVKLLVTDPSKVVLINAPAASVSLECGKLTPRAATVEYLEKPDPQHQTSGEVTAIGFR